MNVKKKIIVFGTDEYYQNYREKLNKYDILAFLNNGIAKQNGVVDSKIVLAPSQVKSLKFDYIYLMGKDWKNMQLQLIDQGIETDIIRNRFDLEKEYIPWEMPTIWRTEYCNKYFDFVLIS